MDTTKYFLEPEAFKNNPMNFVAHRVFNMPITTNILVAEMNLEKGDIEGCKARLKQAHDQLIQMRDFITKFAKEYESEILK